MKTPFILAFALLSLPSFARGQMYRGDPAHTGVYNSPAAEFGGVRWRFDAGSAITSSPVIANGVAFLAGGDGVLRAVDPLTGHVRWHASAAARMRSSPAVSGDFVVVGDVQGIVHAFDRTTGAERWHHETEGHTLGSDTFGYDRRTIQSSPAIMDGRVFVGARDGWIYALDPATGARQWRYDHHISWVNTSPAAENGRVYDGSSDGQFVQALDAASGRERWRTTTALTWASPAIAGDLLFTVDGAAFLAALDKNTGTIRWKWGAGGGIFSSPVVSDGTLFVGTDDGAVYALDVNAAHVMHRAVYADSSYAQVNLVIGDAVIRRWFAGRGYEVLDATSLPRFMEARLADHEPSTIVFSCDYLPESVAAASAPSASLLRRYLDAGGTVVWPGVPPLLWPGNPANGNRDLLHLGRNETAQLLGVTFEHSLFDRDGTSNITAAGRALGMMPGFLSGWSADTSSVTTVLATDEFGNASAWIRSFGGPAGTGFIRIPPVSAGAGGVSNLLVLQYAAEHRGF